MKAPSRASQVSCQPPSSSSLSSQSDRQASGLSYWQATHTLAHTHTHIGLSYWHATHTLTHTRLHTHIGLSFWQAAGLRDE